MEYMQYDESEKDMVLVPSVVLHTILQGAKKEVEEKKQLLAELEKATSELNRLEIHAIKLQEEIDKKKANSHINMRLTSISRARSRIVEKKDLEGGDQTDELDQLFVREENLMALIEATRNISEQSAYLDVVSSAMHAAQNIIAAERYTLAILNDKKTVLEVFANASPQKSEQANFIQEAFIPVDSTTTYGRVILTGKALEVNALMESEFLEGQVENLDFEPQGLLCTPIFNVHGNLVGVFQIITKKTALDSSQPQISHLSGSNSSANPIERSGSRKNYSPFSSLEKESFNYICAVIGTAIWNLTLSKARQAAQSQIDSLLKLNRNISAETNGAAVIEQIVIVSYELLNAERISIYIRSEGTDEFYLANASDVKEEQYQTNHNGIVGFVVRTGEAVLTNDAYAHPEFDPEFDETTGYLSKQILCTPVRNAEGNVLAVICAVNKVDGSEFTHEDLLYLNYAADAAGVSLHKSNLLREVIFSQKITEARLKFTNFVSASTSISDFVNLVMEEGKKIMECDRFGLLLVDHLKKELWITPQVGGQNIRMPINKGISGLVATTGQVVCTRDAYTHPLFDPSVDLKTGYRTTTVLCMPVFEDQASTNPKIVAVAMCINKKEGNRVVSFSTIDNVNMSRYCREIQFALGRLSLDISYYKVVSDGGAPGPNEVQACKENQAKSCSDGLEAEIISSIVHKYCQPNDLLEGLEGIDQILATSSVSDTWAAQAVAEEALLMNKENNGTMIRFGDLDRWDFNSLDLSNPEIFMASSLIFRSYGLLELFHISSEKFLTFLSHVANHYRPNPFHNFQHAFQVMHVTHMLILKECGQYFNRVDIFTMLISSLCHDIDHPGNNNDFEVKSLSPMALTHNDDSVLERHHCRVTFIILGNQAANILENIPRESFFKIRKLIIHCILSTDMSKHFEKCKILEGLTKKQLHEKKYTLISIILHAADLSAQTLPYDQAVRWGMRVLNEFQNQAKSEQELKLPVDSFMTNLHQMKTRFTVQINFINFVLRPIWIPLASLCQNLRIYADTLESNFEHYKEDLEKVNTNSESNDNVNTTAPVGSGARHTLTRGDTMRTSITGNSHLDVINIVRKKLVDRKQRLSAGNLATK